MGNARTSSIVLGAGVVLAAALLTPPAEAEANPSGSFTALSYNVAGLPEGLSGSEPTRNSPLISPLLDAYDVVLLQEDWADVAHDQRTDGTVPTDAPRTGFHDVIVGQAQHPFRSEPVRNPPVPAPQRVPTGPALNADGLNRLSDFAFGPLTRVMWTACNGELSLTVGQEALKATGLDDVFDDQGLGVINDEVHGGSTDCAAQKGWSVATTTLADGVEVDIYNLHGEAGNGEKDRAASRAGFAQLADFILEHSDGKAIILGGDTNLHTEGSPKQRDWETEVWRTFRDRTGIVDVCDVLDCDADAGRIDKFAFRSSTDLTIEPTSYDFAIERFARDDGAPLSDHDPLVVTFAWTVLGSS